MPAYNNAFVYFWTPPKHPGQNTNEFLCLCSEGMKEKRPHIEQSFHPPFHTSNGAFIQPGWLMKSAAFT